MSRQTIKAGFDNIGAQEQPLSITPSMISSALNALLAETVLQSELDQSSIHGDDASVSAANGSLILFVPNNKGIAVQVGNKYAAISSSTIDNLIRAISNPDNRPTASSDNLITSGAVYAALAEKLGLEDAGYDEFTPSFRKPHIDIDTDFANNVHVRHYLINSGESFNLLVPTAFESSDYTLEYSLDASNTSIPAGGWVLVTVRRLKNSDVLYVTLDGVSGLSFPK